jgi:hypothetical protein
MSPSSTLLQADWQRRRGQQPAHEPVPLKGPDPINFTQYPTPTPLTGKNVNEI